MEIEHKFLVANNAYRDMATECHHIIQGYLSDDPSRTVRVRLCDDEAYLTVTGASSQSGLSRFEWEKAVSVADARSLLSLCLPGVIDKHRYIVFFEGRKWEIDEFHGNLEGLVLAEIEVESEETRFALPSFAGREVTGDPHYYNSYLRKTTYLDL